MKSTKVKIAGREYTIESLKFKAERAWRKKYDQPISELIGAISSVSDASKKEFKDAGELMREIGAVLFAQAGGLIKALLESPDTLLDAICEYAPALAADRAFIEENAYQDEITQAFVEVLQIAYPFGSLLGIVKTLGQMEKQTEQNSPSPNGDSGKTI